MGEAYVLYVFVLRASFRNLTDTFSSTLQIFQVRIIFSSWGMPCLTTHSEHLDRVREKVVLLDENKNRSSGKDLVAVDI
jgi:hypothetical protein